MLIAGTFEVIVIGAGHAGIEAALAAARMGCQTLLVSLNLDTIGQMSCNPAIGGLSKGHLVREIDALGGEMAKATDLTGLQFRMLNTKKGPSVWAPRAQCDKKAYQFRMKWTCEQQNRLSLIQAQVTKLLVRNDEVYGIETNLGIQYHSTTVVITTGTFLRGLMHIGFNQQHGGRAGEAAAMSLTGSLHNLGFDTGRLKTGTPPRILKRSIDYSPLEIQRGDEPVPYFTYWKDELFHVEHYGHCKSLSPTLPLLYPPNSILDRLQGQLPCHITYTTHKTAEIIRANLDRSPLYSGKIEGVGPRYCPSIEDKIVKFPEKERHQLFLEPEGISTDEVYVNGFSTSLPFDVQMELIKTIIGCERAEILRPAYAVEYDFVNPTQLQASLETKKCRNLFHAGQINGTSGYEEAAAQGLMAGINAARRVKGCDPIILRRDQAYIGVLIDDLVTKGTTEPYRMFTSRAEYRLTLRQDNADLRLCEIGFKSGLLTSRCYELFCRKRSLIDGEINRLETTFHGSVSLAQILRRPEVTYEELPDRMAHLDQEVKQQVEIMVKYAGYVARQSVDVNKFKSLEAKQIPPWLDFARIPGLRLESRQKLGQIRPSTVGQASRISGVSPADIGLILVWMKRGSDSMTTSPDE